MFSASSFFHRVISYVLTKMNITKQKNSSSSSAYKLRRVALGFTQTAFFQFFLSDIVLSYAHLSKI